MNEQNDLFAIKVPLENAYTEGAKHGFIGKGAVCEHPMHAFVSYSKSYMEGVAEILKIEGATVVKMVKNWKDLDYLNDLVNRWEIEKDTIHKDNRCPIGSEQVFGPGIDQDCYKMYTLNCVNFYSWDKYDVILAPAEMCEGKIFLSFAEPRESEDKRDAFIAARFG